jgi:POT family proton-dependent oligopeptide transporter
MQKIIDQKHDQTTWYYALSRMCERAGYYGMRSILILYIIDESTLGLSQSEAFTIYGWLGTAIILAAIVGALLGDLLIGNKKSMMMGSVIQAIGAFCLAIPSVYALYAGLFIISLGSGLYTPNLLAHFGKSYLNRSQLLDAAFTGLYAIVNIGALLGSVLMAYAGEKYGYEYGFILSGFFMLIALVFPIMAKDQELVAQVPPPPRNINVGQRLLRIVGIIMTGAIFWVIYELNGSEMYMVRDSFSSLFRGTLLPGLERYITELIAIPLTIIALLIWSKLYTRTSLKVLVGIGLTVVALVAISLMPSDINIGSFSFYIIAMIILSLAEICIAPLIFSTITKYADPRYLAIIISLAFIPGLIFRAITSQLYSTYYDSNIGQYVGYGLLAILLMGVTIYFFTSKDGKFLAQSQGEAEVNKIGTES